MDREVLVYVMAWLYFGAQRDSARPGMAGLGYGVMLGQCWDEDKRSKDYPTSAAMDVLRGRRALWFGVQYIYKSWNINRSPHKTSHDCYGLHDEKMTVNGGCWR